MIAVLISEHFPRGECTRYTAPDCLLLGFHPENAQAFLDFVEDDTLVLDLDQDAVGRQFVRDMVLGTIRGSELLEQIMTRGAVTGPWELRGAKEN